MLVSGRETGGLGVRFGLKKTAKKCISPPRPPASELPAQTAAFLQWFNAPPVGDALIKAGMARLWLVTLHPFDDGNGRISRAVGDMTLARAEAATVRFYSFSAQTQRERKHYDDQLEATQKGQLDVTPWLSWFLG